MNIRALVAQLSQYALSNPNATTSIGGFGIVIREDRLLSKNNIVGTIAIEREDEDGN